MNRDMDRIDGTGIILIAGMARSGTTWIGKIFDSHRRNLYRHEPDSVLRDAAIPLVAPPEEIPRLEAASRHYVQKLIAIKTCEQPLSVAGLLARRPLSSLLGTFFFALAIAAVFWRGGIVPDPLVAGAAAPFAFLGIAALAGVCYAIVVAKSLSRQQA